VFVGLKEWVKANPWRLVAIVLGLGLVGSVVALTQLLWGGEEHIGTFEPIVTTVVTEPGETTTVLGAAEGPPLSVDPNAPTESLGSAYVSVKVDNAPEARPQVGLAGVPLLVEYPVEGGITRFTAVVNRDVTGELGPVRSLRPVDADLLPQLAPYVVSTGGEPFVIQDVGATGVNLIDAQLFELFTVGANPEPLHNLFLLLDVLFQTVGDTPQIGAGLPSGAFPGGRAATEVSLPFESVMYRYEDDQYVRYDGASPFEVLDAIGGTAVPLAHDTLVVLTVAERSAGYTDGNDVPVTTFDVIGVGDLRVIHQGEAVEGTWLRGAQEDGYRFYDSNGESFGLPQGRIYVALVPRGLEVTY
jgi:hypothetical protein